MNPAVPPRPDVSYVGVTTKPPGTPNSQRDGERSRGDTPRSHIPPPIPPHPMHGRDNEWEAHEEMRLRELEEARARAAQMEKTMRWWSDCTANWREKWSKVRNERNKAREECRQLRSKLESTIKENTVLKREKQELLGEVGNLKKNSDHEKDHLNTACSNSPQSQSERSSSPAANVNQQQEEADDSSASASVHDQTNDQTNDDSNFMDKLLSKKDSDSPVSSEKPKSKKKTEKLQNEVDMPQIEQKLQMYQLRLQETQQTIQAERTEKVSLVKSVEKLQTELHSMRSKYEELKRSNQLTSKELNKLKDKHNDEMGRMNLELEDESENRSNLDRRLGDLRKELERLQAENAKEWGLRERLETEKMVMERENKKLHSQLEDLEELLEAKNREAAIMVNTDLKTMQAELAERNKELVDLKHVHSKLKKALQDKTTELDHAKRRAEQYEIEVKKLRGRIDDLKKDLATAEDDVDTYSNQVRKLQRTNDELQQQVENLSVQVEHLNSRLRSSSKPFLSSRTSSLKSYDPNSASEVTTDDDVED